MALTIALVMMGLELSICQRGNGVSGGNGVRGNGASVQLADKLLAAHVLMLFVNKLHTDPVFPAFLPFGTRVKGWKLERTGGSRRKPVSSSRKGGNT